MELRDLGKPPMVVYFGTDDVAVIVDREETNYDTMSMRELEILLSLLNFASARVRRQLRRRVNSGQ